MESFKMSGVNIRSRIGVIRQSFAEFAADIDRNKSVVLS